ncbi:hypothetical protein V8F20_006939 [Naviculisporaceae sp. PSN 640]
MLSLLATPKMHVLGLLLFNTAATVLAVPSGPGEGAFPINKGILDIRATGDACTGTEGRGTCQKTSNCRGISYPQPFCPNDPDDVQCCVEISCNVGGRSGFCRSVSNNGCLGGTFDPGNYCPGSQDIQCCLKGSETGVGASCKVGSQSGICRSVSKDGCAGGHFDPGNYCPGSQDVQCCLKSGSSEPGVGTSCRVGSQSGTCLSVSRDGCAGGHFDPGNYCPGSQDVQCCLKGGSSEPGVGSSCNVAGKAGTCLSVSRDGCAGGYFDPGNYCPGSQDVQCCLKSGTGGGGGDVGQRVLAKAMEAAGLPYAWGGGSCSGPSRDQPPYQYGETGFDCSGLVCWAVCQVTGRNLFAAGLRVTHSMYCASESTLGYKKYPYSQRKAGDAVFFGGACNCNTNRAGIHHVGLVMSDGGDMMWNAPNDDINRVMAMSISGFGEAPCPYVIRFT